MGNKKDKICSKCGQQYNFDYPKSYCCMCNGKIKDITMKNDKRLETRIPAELLKQTQKAAKKLNIDVSCFTRDAIKEKINRMRLTTGVCK